MQVCIDTLTLSLPMPIFVVVEDVGWWQGSDGSASGQPFRNGFARQHLLADYQALARLARRLRMRIAVGMVLGEWDRRNLLWDVPGATWMGSSWDNRSNCGPWLDEAAQLLRDHEAFLEIACHGLCHEFWHDGRMERSEFHDRSGRMRSAAVVRSHLDAYARLLNDHALPGFPRLFLPPALDHSCGNGRESMQAILHDYGVRYVVTGFSKAHWHTPPLHDILSWECGVCLLERGSAPVPWHQAAAPPAWDFGNPVLPLHWSNLLHLDPEKNSEIVDGWAEMLEARASSMEFVLAADVASCWNQAAAYHLLQAVAAGGKITIDHSSLQNIPEWDGSIICKIRCPPERTWQCRGGLLESIDRDPSGIDTALVRPLPGYNHLEFYLIQ